MLTESIRKLFLRLTLIFIFSTAFLELKAQVVIPFANQQPQWVFPLYFEDYNGDKDTLYFAYDSSATNIVSFPPDTFDLRFGEGFVLLDTSKFTAAFQGIGDSIRKVIAVPGLPSENILLYNVRMPFTIKWIDTLFYDSLLPVPSLYPYPNLMAEMWCADLPPYVNCPTNFPLCIVAEDPLSYCNGAMPNVMDSMFFDNDTNYVGFYGFDFRIKLYTSWVGFDESRKLDSLNSIEVFPNPASRWIEITTASTNYTLTIIDILGREKKHLGTFKGKENRIDVSFLNDGIYFLQIDYENKSYFTKMIKTT